MSTVKIERKLPAMQQIVVGYNIGESLNTYGYFITPSQDILKHRASSSE